MYYIYIQFTKPKGKIFPIFSWAIRLFQNTPYSHVRLSWKSTSGVGIVYEASGSMVKVIGEEASGNFPVEIIKEYRIEVTPQEYKKLVQLFRFSGVAYGVFQIFGILLTKIFNLKRNPLSTGYKSQVCSELLGIFLKDVKNWDIDFDLDTAGPKEIDEYLQNNPKAERTK